MDLLNNPDVQEIAVSVAALLASAAFAAFKGTEIYRSTIAGREDKILGYIETGARTAYSAYVRKIKRQRGRLSPLEAQRAREIALEQAALAARANGQSQLLSRLTDRELEARLESVLQEIKAGAAMGEPARAANRASNSPGPLNGLILAVIVALSLSACANLGMEVDIQPGQTVRDPAAITITPGKYESEAINAWAIWDTLGERGTLPDHPATGKEADRREAFRYAQALAIYSVAQIRSRKPVPGLPATLEESGRCLGWYLREAHPHVELSWEELYSALKDSEQVPERLLPLLEYRPG